MEENKNQDTLYKGTRTSPTKKKTFSLLTQNSTFLRAKLKLRQGKLHRIYHENADLCAQPAPLVEPRQPFPWDSFSWNLSQRATRKQKMKAQGKQTGHQRKCKL